MSKTETLRQFADASNAKRVESLTQQIEALRQAKLQSAEELAAVLEPLAQAMAALTDETRETLAQLREQSSQQMAEFQTQSQNIVNTWHHSTQLMDDAGRQLREATDRFTQGLTQTVNEAAWRLGWKHYALTMATGILAAMLTLGLWTWLSPKPVTPIPPSKPSVTVPHKPSPANSKHSG
jgi:type I site-specific restriction endonuclease